jgi:amino acid adenylation domain-containing protein/non-ribosomal peptide synthase protein (TIGR01720 family)
MTPLGLHRAVEASYELSPLQHGMLFHSLSSDASGVDIEQIICDLDEVLNAPALFTAWQRVVARHPILRTRFRVDGVAQSVQEVYRSVEIPVAELDWSTIHAGDCQARWSTLLEADRRRGFDVSQAPLMRLTLVWLPGRVARLLWTFHHAVLDGRSFPLVLREVFAYYEAIRDGRELDLPLPRPYGDYIEWLHGQDPARAEEYWRRLLKGFTTPTPLRVGQNPRTAPAAQGTHGAHEARVAADVTAGLRDFAEKHELTVNTLLQGAWALLLHIYSGEDDIVFGATRACRRSSLEGADDMVGLFINTLPVRVRVKSDAPLVPWLRELRRQGVALRAHEHTPLVKIQDWSDVPRGTPLFESLVVYERYLLNTALRAQGGEWTGRRFRYLGQTNYPLTFIAYADAELLLRLEYDRRRFDDDTAARMLDHVGLLLEGMITAADQPLRAVPYLTATERAELVPSPNPLPIGPANGLCIHQRFERQVARTPDAVAVIHDGRALTYRQLNRGANRLARRLRELSVGPEVLVGLFVERCVDMVMAIIAILKAGGAYLPLDPRYPKDRLAFMLEDSEVAVLLTQGELASALPPHRARMVLLEGDSGEEAADGGAAEDNVSGGATADSLAYVIYTSGSTGRPKGVLITHRNVVRLMDATDPWFRFGPADAWTLFHSYAFDFSVWELWGALLYGGRLVLVPYWVSRSPEAFAELLYREQVTVLNQTPSAFRQLMQVILEGESRGLALRYVIFGGEALDLQALRPWFERFGDRPPRLINMYGITETTVHVTYRPIALNDVLSGSGSVIGRSIPDLQVYVLDHWLRPVPIGVAGEIYIGGAGVGRGYLNRPELTAERFIADPFTAAPGARLYRSGDLARRLPNGDLEYLGRIDDQVKIRGFRIELGEIESALAQHSAVRESVVIVREDIPGDKRLVAYYVADRDAPLMADEIRGFLRAKLPDYMVPAAFVRLDGLPLTGHGKVDRKALPALDQTRPDVRGGYVAPRTAIEETLSGIWAAVLGLERVGVHDSFFELGGDSILAIQIIARARQAGLSFTPRELFQHSTIAELAAVTAVATPQDDGHRAEGCVPLTPIQRWFFEQELPEPDHWNQAFLFEVPTDVDVQALEAASQHVVDHHDSFRLRFRRGAHGWEQRYTDDGGTISVAEIDLSGRPDAELPAAIEAKATELQRTLDIADGPLLRIAHFGLGPRRPGRLLVIAHHLVIDGVSWRILLGDVDTLYRALHGGDTVRLPARTTSYQGWAQRLIEYAQWPACRNQLSHWLATANLDSASLPVDFEGGANTEMSARTVTWSIGIEETRALLQRVPQVFRAQVDDVLLAALARCLTGWTKGGSLCVDVEGHGREAIFDDVDLSRTVGWFTSIFPLRLEPPRGPLADVLHAVKEQLRQVPGRGIGYGVLRYLGDPTTATLLGDHPQPAVLFNYLGQFDQVLAGSSLFRFAAEPAGPWHSQRAPRRHLIDLLALVIHGRLQMRWTYSENIHRRQTVERLAQSFVEAVREVLLACETRGATDARPAHVARAAFDLALLDRLPCDLEEVEDIYALSPMQRLFHSMEAAGSGLEQWQYRLHGSVDAPALRRAWELVVNRHSILRTAFVSDGQRELQVVVRRVALPWSEHDWSALSATDQSTRLAELVESDAAQGFDLSRAPLTRVTLLRLADETFHLLWTTHHLHVDGWSWPLIFSELSECYEALRAGRDARLAPPHAYRDYIGWLEGRNSTETEAFWRRWLAGFTAPTPLGLPPAPAGRSEGAGQSHAEEEVRLSERTGAALRSFARSYHLTLSMLVQGAWGLLLSHRSGQADVVFGVTFSGRPPQVAGIESMVGTFVSNLPIRLQVRPEMPVPVWLAEAQDKQADAVLHQYVSPLEIQAWTGVPWRLRLFDSLLVFQNYAVSQEARRLGPTVEIAPVSMPEATNYPLTLVVTPAPELRLKMIYRRNQFDGAAIRRSLAALAAVLEAMTTATRRTIADILAVLPPPPDGQLAVAGLDHRSKEGAAYLAPRTRLEQAIAAIWQELFEVERVGLDDNFFDLGGHSILLVETHTRLQARLGLNLPIVALLQYPTVSALAGYLSHQPNEASCLSHVRDRARRQRDAQSRPRRIGRNP